MSAQYLPELPPDWRTVPAKALFSERREIASQSDVHLTPSQLYGVVTQADYMQRTGSRVVQVIEGGDNMKRVEPDDFVIHLRSFQGGIERSTISGKVSPAYTVLTPRAPAVPDYFRWVLKSDAYVQELRTTTNQLRDGQSIKFPNFSEVPLPCPPLRAHRTIADYLDRETAQIDTLIAKQEQLIATLRERRIALMMNRVTKGLDETTNLVESGVDWIGAVPSHWRCGRLKYSVADAQTGTWGDEPRNDGTDVICIRVADFDRSHLGVGPAETMRSVRPADFIQRALKAGDLLLEKSGGTGLNPVGFVAYFAGTESPAVCSNFITRLRVAQGQVSRYWLYAHAASYSTRLTARSVNQTTGIQNLDQQAYFDEIFPFPPAAEQEMIARALYEDTARIDALIDRVHDFIALARERRSALITAAVTGQIDVNTAA